jgi:putative oxidoreductase
MPLQALSILEMFKYHGGILWYMNLKHKKLVRTIQVIFGVYLVFSGITGLFQLFPAPQLNQAGTAFLGALFDSGYVFQVMSLVFLLAGIMFIFDKWSAFGAVLLAPIFVNILLFHVFLDFTNFWIALIPIVLNGYLFYVYWPRYKPMFRRKA